MAHIFKSQLYAGNQTCLEFDPDVLVLRDHVFNPDPTLGCPGIYDFGRKLIHQSIYSRGPNPIDIFPSIQPHFSYSDVEGWAEDDCYIFLGLLHDHFGHFLLSTLSRLWNVQKLPKHKIISYAPSYIWQMKKPYVRDILSALDIDPARFVTFEKPVKVREIILPYTCFEEQNFVHRVFACMCNSIGDRLVNKTVSVDNKDQPAYLSKEKIKYGVRKIINEGDICDYLSKHGVEILYPEELSFPEQIMIWRKSRPIVAFSSSGLHTSIFSPNPKMVCLSHEPRINTSFTLCDWANNTDANYFHFENSAFEDLGPSPELENGRGMSSELRAANPGGVAEAVLRAIDTSTRSKSRWGKVNGHVNISLGCLTTQSSSAYENEAGGPSATSGFLTGKYQFHTSFQHTPWWQVDLGRECQLSEIIIYNRTDAGLDRAAELSILISQDGERFDLVYTREGHASFGGLNGDAFRYEIDGSRRARFVRLSIPGPNFLHLDQVEVFGRPVLETVA